MENIINTLCYDKGMNETQVNTQGNILYYCLLLVSKESNVSIIKLHFLSAR